MVYMYLHSPKKKRSTNHPNVGKYTHFSHGWYGYQIPNLYLQSSKADPSLRQRGPWCAPPLRTAPRALGVAGEVSWEATIQFFDPRQQSLGKNPAQKTHVFLSFFFCWENWRSNWIWVGAGYVFWKMISDLMNWWLVRDDGWWVMMRRRLSICLIQEVCVQISIEVWFKSNPTLSDSYDELKPFQALQVQIGGNTNQLLPQAHSNHRRDWLAISQTPNFFRFIRCSLKNLSTSSFKNSKRKTASQPLAIFTPKNYSIQFFKLYFGVHKLD